MTGELQRDITFKQSEGKTRSGLPVKFAQDEIFVNGVRVGYVGHNEGEAVLFIRPVDAETSAIIAKQVEERRGSAPSAIRTAAQIEDRPLDYGDDDE